MACFSEPDVESSAPEETPELAERIAQAASETMVETPRPGDLIAQVHRRKFDVEILEDELHHSEKVSAQIDFNPKTGEFEVFVHETCETYRVTTHTKISVE